MRDKFCPIGSGSRIVACGGKSARISCRRAIPLEPPLSPRRSKEQSARKLVRADRTVHGRTSRKWDAFVLPCRRPRRHDFLLEVLRDHVTKTRRCRAAAHRWIRFGVCPGRTGGIGAAWRRIPACWPGRSRTANHFERSCARPGDWTWNERARSRVGILRAASGESTEVAHSDTREKRPRDRRQSPRFRSSAHAQRKQPDGVAGQRQ